MDRRPDGIDTNQEQQCSTKVRGAIRRNLLLCVLLIAIVLGVVLGVCLRFVSMSPLQQFYLGFPGELLMNMLKMLVLPLIMSSLISSMTALNVHLSGRIGLRTLLFYVTTTLVAAVLGIVLVLSIRPGTRGREYEPRDRTETTSPLDAFMDIIRSLFPPNLIEACTFRYVSVKNKTVVYINKSEEAMTYINKSEEAMTYINKSEEAMTHENFTRPTVDFAPNIMKVEGMNVLGLVLFSLLLGRTIAVLGEKGKPLKDFFDSMAAAVIALMWTLMWYCPIGITFLIAGKIVELTDPLQTLLQMGYYLITVLSGLIIHGYIILPLLYFIVIRKNPFPFVYNQIEALVAAFAIDSSIAVAPVTMRCLEEKNHVDPRIIKFVAPLGATVNMDGTALFEAVSCIFIAQLNNIPLSLGQVITISITATLAAIGAASVPHAGLVTMLLVLAAVGLPTDDVALIFAVDWFTDRCRTTTNVLGDAIGAGIIEHLSRRELRLMDEYEEELVVKVVPERDVNNGPAVHVTKM